jgi:AraC-like DNA-binding protein
MRTLYVRPSEASDVEPRCAVIAVSSLLRELVLRTAELGMLDERTPSHLAMARLILSEISERSTPPLDLPMPTSTAARWAADRIQEGDRSMGLDELARASAMSRRSLERRFEEETGMTLGRWRRQARLLDALRQLASGELVKTVSQNAEYSSPSAFIAAFRAVFGVTPARYFAATPPEASRHKRIP